MTEEKTISEQVKKNLGIKFLNSEDSLYLNENMFNKIVNETRYLFAEDCQREIHNLLFDKEWHKHHKAALTKCIDIIEDKKKQQGIE